MDSIISPDTSIWLIAKIAILIGLLVYLVFAFVVVMQVNLMTDTLELGHENTIRAISVAHLIFALFVFFFAFVIL